MGNCAELHIASNGCCFPASSTCSGTRRMQDKKYVVDECHPSASNIEDCTEVSSNVGKQQYYETRFSGGCVTLTEDVEEIAEGGFEYSIINFIRIPHTLKTIGKQAFKAINDQQGRSGMSAIWLCDPSSGAFPSLESYFTVGEKAF